MRDVTVLEEDDDRACPQTANVAPSGASLTTTHSPASAAGTGAPPPADAASAPRALRLQQDEANLDSGTVS